MRPFRSERWMAEAGKKLNTKLVRHAQGEACGPCPRCGGKDRFICFAEGNYFCRRCHHKGWWADDPEEGRKRVAEERVRQEEQQATLRRRMATCQDWVEYHQDALELVEARELWKGYGMGEAEIQKWGLGFCRSCPTAPDHCGSLTIPCFQGGIRLDIRHRLLNVPPEFGKYRSHLAGLRPPIFNLDSVEYGDLVAIVEGEKKAIILDKFGFKAVVALPGINFAKYFLDLLPDRITGNQRAVVLLDPHTNRTGEKLARALCNRGVETRVADSYMKPDDMLLRYGTGPMSEILKQAREV